MNTSLDSCFATLKGFLKRDNKWWTNTVTLAIVSLTNILHSRSAVWIRNYTHKINNSRGQLLLFVPWIFTPCINNMYHRIAIEKGDKTFSWIRRIISKKSVAEYAKVLLFLQVHNVSMTLARSYYVVQSFKKLNVTNAYRKKIFFFNKTNMTNLHYSTWNLH